MKQDEDRSTLTTHIPDGNNYREKILGSGSPWWGSGQGQRAQLGLQEWGAKVVPMAAPGSREEGHIDLLTFSISALQSTQTLGPAGRCQPHPG